MLFNSTSKPAIFIENQVLSYKDLNLLIDSYCGQLKSFSLPKQSRIAFLASIDISTIAFFCALWRLQLIACPLNPKLPTQTLKHSLDILDAHGLITLPECYLELFHKKQENEQRELATMLLTSGTTTDPKVACHSLENFLASASCANPLIDLQSNDRYLFSLPLFHVSGISILIRVLQAQAAFFIANDPRSFFEPVTHLSLVPTQLYRLLQEESQKIPTFTHLKCILIGGAPIPKHLYEQALSLNLKPFLTYGMTEMSSMITLKSPLDPTYSLGKVLPCNELKIGKDHEILVRGKTLFQGYWNRNDGLVLPLKEGWFSTKDLGNLSDTQTLSFLGRKDNLFISGGENIYPEEIEETLLTLHGIEQAIVIPFDDPEFGHLPAAYIYTPKNKWTLSQIQNSLKKYLPSYKVPKKLFILERMIEKYEKKS